MKTSERIPPVHPFLFETAWGWCGAGVCEQGVVFLHLPAPDIEAVLRRIEDRIRPRGADSVYLPAVALSVDADPGPWPLPAVALSRNLIRQIRGYFEGCIRDFDLPMAWQEGAPWRRRVWIEARRIPYGETCSYGELAVLAGSPNAARAVGQCMANNPTSLLVPCHRVLGATGALGGFSAEAGVALKKRLLEWERKNLMAGGTV